MAFVGSAAPLRVGAAATASSLCGAPVSRPVAARRAAAAVTMGATTDSRSNMDGVSITLDTLVYTPNPVPATTEEKDLLCTTFVKQVFGNAYVMEEERSDFYVAESMYRAGQLPMKELVRAAAKSDTYRRRFWDACGPYRYTELAFKHLLGRGVNSQAEAAAFMGVAQTKGYYAAVDWIIDSEEYDQKFGDDFVPGMLFRGTYSPNEDFNRMSAAYSSPGTSDKSLTGRARVKGIDNANRVLSLEGAGVPSKFVSTIASNGATSFTAVAKGLPKRSDIDRQDRNSGLIKSTPAIVNESAAPRRRVEVVPGSYMYLTPAEEAEFTRSNYGQSKDAAAKKGDLASKKAMLAELQKQIAALEMSP
ncbi:hypothetical protein MMPV_004131 [Pyropia vietnamensis]